MTFRFCEKVTINPIILEEMLTTLTDTPPHQWSVEKRKECKQQSKIKYHISIADIILLCRFREGAVLAPAFACSMHYCTTLGAVQE